MQPSSRPSRRRVRSHPLEHHGAYRAVIAALPALTNLSAALRATGCVGVDLCAALGVVGQALAAGFDEPPGSARRHAGHRRAWIAVRQLDRVVDAATRGRLAPPGVLAAAQRVVDRADVLIAALPGVLIN